MKNLQNNSLEKKDSDLGTKVCKVLSKQGFSMLHGLGFLRSNYKTVLF